MEIKYRAVENEYQETPGSSCDYYTNVYIQQKGKEVLLTTLFGKYEYEINSNTMSDKLRSTLENAEKHLKLKQQEKKAKKQTVPHQLGNE